MLRSPVNAAKNRAHHRGKRIARSARDANGIEA
jgi:hypothetical protein